MSSAGRAGSTSGCVSKPKGRETGLQSCVRQIRSSSLTGSYVMETAEQQEPYESRGSRTVLGAPGGESPLGDSTRAERLGMSTTRQDYLSNRTDRRAWQAHRSPNWVARRGTGDDSPRPCGTGDRGSSSSRGQRFCFNPRPCGTGDRRDVPTADCRRRFNPRPWGTGDIADCGHWRH